MKGAVIVMMIVNKIALALMANNAAHTHFLAKRSLSKANKKIKISGSEIK